MSEEINSSHICTTEDAFEKFQAVSMYEENEYITLSDIVPDTQERAPELVDEICDIPYDQEVVLESNLDEQVHEVNSTNEPGFDEFNTLSGPSDEQFKCTSENVDSNSEAGHNDDPEAGHNNVTEVGSSEAIETVEPRVARRGGRKKKNATVELTAGNVLNNGTQDLSVVGQEQSADVVMSTGQGRRGSRPKNVSQNTELNPEIGATAAEIPKENGTSSNVETPFKDDSHSENLMQRRKRGRPPLKKRGRPKKKSFDQQISELTSSSDAAMQNSKNNDITVNTSESSSTKESRKRVNNSRSLSSEKSELVDQNMTDAILNPPIKKSPGKRGRPRKNNSYSTDLNLEQSKLNTDDDDADDVCLSQLKTSLDTQESTTQKCEISEVIRSDINTGIDEVRIEIELADEKDANNDVSTTMHNTADDNEKIPDIESKPENESIMNESDLNNLLVEDTSKRPTRRRTRKPMHYDEESDEDPFANVELSDDEPIGCKKKYYSDDEYIPGKMKNIKESSDSDSDIDLDTIDEELTEQKRKRPYKKSDGTPTKGAKRGRKSVNDKVTEESLPGVIASVESGMNEDIEDSIKPSIIKTNEEKKCSKEFENFLAKKIQGTDIKIKKKSTVQPLEIPVIDPKKQKKTAENSTQTKQISTASTSVQTAAVYDIPMKENVTLTSEQSEKACEFLNSIVQTTAELGELMTQKSQDFMKKKINTEHVTDTFKMDYCVKKSFLLFKLAKHNLMQMEEDLAKQYDTFLNTHNLQEHREQPKVVTAAPKTEGSDSDCEIIETPVVQNQEKKKKPAFNPKTVFLNKELSIKIAKKTPTPEAKPQEKKINIKGRHTVWINDSVMVKKVKPTQSFLAQDSRKKKPPDCVTIEMVNDFFEKYYRQKTLAACAPYLSPIWLTPKRDDACCYFFAETAAAASVSPGIPSASGESDPPDSNNLREKLIQDKKIYSPKTLFTLCTRVLQDHLYYTTANIDKINEVISVVTKHEYNPNTLYGLCVNTINKINLSQDFHDNVRCGSVLTLLEQEGDCEYYKCVLTSSLSDYDGADTVSGSSVLDEEEILQEPTCEKVCSPISVTVKTLKTLSYQQVVKCMFAKERNIEQDITQQTPTMNSKNFIWNLNDIKDYQGYIKDKQFSKTNRINGVKSLFSMCYDLLHSRIISDLTEECIECETKRMSIIPKSLKYLTFKRIIDLMKGGDRLMYYKEYPKKVKTLSDLCFQIVTKCFSDHYDSTTHEGLTINSVNTLTEEAYHNIEHPELAENSDYYEDDSNFYEDETESGLNNLGDNSATVEDNWLSQVQMKELRSCYTSNVGGTETDIQDPDDTAVIDQPLMTRIKTEPLDEFQENIDLHVAVKTEPISHHPDEMTMIPENIVTKTEFLDGPPPREPIQRQNSNSYDRDTFEAFVSTNKMMQNLNDEEEVFSQSALRVRRQYEPDDLSDNDMGMSLLVPQMFEPLRIGNNAKDCLMESSSDESGNSKKVPGKKKTEKRSRVRTKRNDNKASTKAALVPPNKEKLQDTNEIATLTRKMREKIRQEEKKVVSSESDTETESILAMKARHKEERKKAKVYKIPEVSKPSPNKDTIKTKPEDVEIQCSAVDSTEQINENRNMSPSINNFSGFTAVDQNEISSYQKYVKYVYDQILPKVTDQAENSSKENDDQPIINPEDPVELLECEPTMPFFPEPSSSSVKRRPGPKTKTRSISPPKDDSESQSAETKKDEIYVERYGWKCYPLNGNDTKLYQNTQIKLEKLPESFVQTYFIYQNIKTKDDEDEEVDRLINLHSLNRVPLKDGKGNKDKLKCKKSSGQPESSNKSRSKSPTFTENAAELTPSEDEGGGIEDEVPPPISKPTSDNNLAKTSLMDDNDSDADESDVSKIKKEPFDVDSKTGRPKTRKSKSKAKAEQVPAGPVMLTADKMMNKELNLLHAPVTLNVTAEATPAKTRSAKQKQKSGSKTSPKENMKGEDDSESEEEKHQWFTIKEKLLKRMVKKNDTTREDDAKRAKLVSEFIERRGDSSEAYIKKRRGPRGRRISKKKMLERQKQLKVLSRELFGDPSNDTSLHPKRTVQQSAYFKGRRNIRKVIDKKSLARSTVVANMEEFERKRRIYIRQSKLREIMQCEEGVNVLVINDEVCLEYDFDRHRPTVTIHPFFTKVMKAHQYEGVKFMWDACFESLDMIAAGSPGGGCILAHCMGLGKTLQVLALLHTVLTHPRVGTARVLVCCPLSTVLNWVDEIHKWIGPVTDQIKVFELSKLKKTSNRAYQLEDWYNGGGIFIIGYELFRSLTTLDPFLDDVRPAIINKIRTALLDPGPDIIICDEGHLLKNDCSVLAVAMSRVATKRRIVLTGTPMQNNLREYYCMVNFVKPNLLGTYAEYSNRFENPIMNGQHRDSREEDIKLMKARTHILHKVLEGCLQRQEASVLYPYLPKKHEYTVFISLTKCQWDLYKHYIQNYSKYQSNKSVLKDFHILQKIWSHPQVLHNFQSRSEETARNKVKAEKLEDDLAREDLDATEDIKPADTEVWWLQYLEGGSMLNSLASSNKFVAVFRILEESVALNDKVLIFSTSLFTMDTLEYFLKTINNWSLGQEYYRLDGSVPAEVRQKWCREFNAEHNHKTKLFLISTRAGSLGLNMTAANRVIILDTSWNPAHDIQSIFRVYRFGQKKDCYIYRLVALGTMEQKIYERSVTKQAVACRVVDEQQIDRHYNMAELTELYKFDETGAGVAGGLAVGVEDVVLLRVARDAALHAVHEHDSLLRGSLEQGLPEHERDAAWVQFQEEHAHKQEMQEMPPVPVKVKKVKVASQLPVALAALNEPPSHSDWEPVKTETEESILPNDPDFTPQLLKPKSKRGKGRPAKNNVVSCCIPIQPEAPEAEDISLDEEMVKKITHILIKHNYQNNQGQRKIAELVARVRNLVYSGNVAKLDGRDELTMSIAKVLLGKDTQTPPLANDVETSQPVHTVVKQEQVETSQPKSASKSRGRPKKGKAINPEEKVKKGYVYEEVTQPSTSTQPDPEPESDGRRRRRAALAAERNFETLPIGDPVIDLENEDSRDNANDNEFLPELPIEFEPPGAADGNDDSDSPEDLVFSNIRIKTEADLTTTKTPKNSRQTQKKKDSYPESKGQKNSTPSTSSQIIEEQSIVLSDEDDVPPVSAASKKPGPARKTMPELQESQSTSVDDEVVPLHPSLLSNKNFIKIVAHTYLSGNPMLDEDAATLAAQYSTFKALKEFEANGKSINGGPIYDIAIKVLGISVLKKLQKSNVKMTTSELLAQHPINTQEAAPAKDTALKKASKTEDKKSETPSNKPEAPKYRGRPARQSVQSTAAQPTQSQTASQPVTAEPTVAEKKPPVMIKIRLPQGALSANKRMSAASVSAAMPSNVVPVGLFKGAADTASESHMADECILPDDDDIRIITEPAPAAATRRHPPPLVLNKVLADSEQQAASAATAPVQCISLDSDDEEPPAPSAPNPVGPAYAAGQPPPVPVSLTSVQPSAGPPKLLRKVHLTRPSSAGSQLVLTPTVQSVGGGKFVLMPSTTYPQAASVAISHATPMTFSPARPAGFTRAPVPVALNRVQYDARGDPVPAQPTAFPIVSNDIGAEQTVETTPPVTNKRVCKPGDILRISKGGTIELLKRKDAPASRTVAATPPPPPTPPQPLVQTRILRGTTPNNQAPPRRYQKKNAPPTDQNAVSSANNTRSSSPSEIFRNVVHIEADNYTCQASSDTIKITPTKEVALAQTSGNRTVICIDGSDGKLLSNASTVSHTAKTPTSNLNTSMSNPKAFTSTAKATHSIIKPSSSITKPSTNTKAPTSNAKPQLANTTLSKTASAPSKTTPNKAKESLLCSVDLTDTDYLPPVSVTSQKKSKANTIVGTSKSIILCASGKAVAKTDANTKISTLKSASKVDKAASAPKMDTKKRPAPVDTSTAKKKKTDKPMTLKDFDIDDIDGIIELD